MLNLRRILLSLSSANDRDWSNVKFGNWAHVRMILFGRPPRLISWKFQTAHFSDKSLIDIMHQPGTIRWVIVRQPIELLLFLNFYLPLFVWPMTFWTSYGCVTSSEESCTRRSSWRPNVDYGRLRNCLTRKKKKEKCVCLRFWFVNIFQCHFNKVIFFFETSGERFPWCQYWISIIFTEQYLRVGDALIMRYLPKVTFLSYNYY